MKLSAVKRRSFREPKYERRSIVFMEMYGQPLTDRECQIVWYLANDASPGEAAIHLRLSIKTVYWHMESIRAKLGKHTTHGCVAEVLRRELVK